MHGTISVFLRASLVHSPLILIVQRFVAWLAGSFSGPFVTCDTCVCLCVCACVHVRVYGYLACVLVSECAWECVYVLAYVYVHAYVIVCPYMWICMCIRVSVYMCRLACMCM